VLKELRPNVVGIALHFSGSDSVLASNMYQVCELRKIFHSTSDIDAIATDAAVIISATVI
jgi:hypothetical protein